VYFVVKAFHFSAPAFPFLRYLLLTRRSKSSRRALYFNLPDKRKQAAKEI
jgi:hypothetical protein